MSAETGICTLAELGPELVASRAAMALGWDPAPGDSGRRGASAATSAAGWSRLAWASASCCRE
jgi:hypothetical protein